ncbi:helix-turn-helix domain-containing protein [Aeromicrobium phragmitis]|uniref:Helix-turn-helix domain-containing protein n=1 Tax=Aeromicrobium phragmitis TaxID=2478914 RepID=A0A3L8PP52_9ACTN|nr:helix-turn-helix domain-containing protein [Aeromicrobium phragmitis]RLV57176.1 helix-turn-helix domain-containing protein [Aeromicrobium phragmitis]
MTRSWKEVRKEASDAGLIDEQRVSNARKVMREESFAHQLAEIRKQQGLSQEKVARSMGVKQPRVSAIENGKITSAELGTLKSYIHGLGGHLKLVADFGGKTVVIRDDD